jgi:hypothetical protein
MQLSIVPGLPGEKQIEEKFVWAELKRVRRILKQM